MRAGVRAQEASGPRVPEALRLPGLDVTMSVRDDRGSGGAGDRRPAHLALGPRAAAVVAADEALCGQEALRAALVDREGHPLGE